MRLFSFNKRPKEEIEDSYTVEWEVSRRWCWHNESIVFIKRFTTHENALKFKAELIDSKDLVKALLYKN